MVFIIYNIIYKNKKLISLMIKTNKDDDSNSYSNVDDLEVIQKIVKLDTGETPILWGKVVLKPNINKI